MYYDEVNVISYYFVNGSTKRWFPQAIEINGERLSFLKTGVQCLVKMGDSFIKVFNMSDLTTLYRISFDPITRSWKLLGKRTLGEV